MTALTREALMGNGAVFHKQLLNNAVTVAFSESHVNCVCVILQFQKDFGDTAKYVS